MVKRSGRDQREEEEEPEDSAAERFRVDRVFVPARSPGTGHAPTPRSRSTTTPPLSDDVVGLRRQVAKLQHQLADAQRELAGKGDELAGEVEHRLLITAARDKLLSDLERVEQRVREAMGIEGRLVTLEARLAETLQRNEQLLVAVDKETAGRTEAETRVGELEAAIDEARIKRIEERAALDEQHTAALESAEEASRTALAQAEAGFETVIGQLRESHRAEVEELAEAHQRELAALRGELEPQVHEGRAQAAEREKLAGELEALRVTSERMMSEQRQTYERELARLVELHTADLATKARAYAAEITKVLGERDVEILEHQQTVRRAEVRELHFEQTTLAFQDQIRQLQNQLAAAGEREKTLASDREALEAELAKATAANGVLSEEAEDLHAQLEMSERDVRRAAQQREQLVEWLRDGMRVLDGPAFEEDEQTIAMEADEPPPSPPDTKPDS